MAGSNYNMNPGWNQPQSNPQLENEFDPNMYNVVADGSQRFGRRQGPQDLSYPTYPQQYAPAPQQNFTFSMPARTVDQSYDNPNFFDPQASTSTQHATQSNVYGGPSSSLQDAHIAPAIYRDNSQGYSYPQSAHQTGDMHLGPSQGTVESSPAIAPSHSDYNPVSTTQQGHAPSVFVSPPPHPNNYDQLYQSPPQDRPIDPQLGVPRRTNLPFYGQREPVQVVQDVPSAPSAKRQRGPEDANDGEGPNQDPENKGEVQKPKPAGACARCKQLKVKCEFVNDPDICKRCLNGGHECLIPGRKKRKPPPKREHLLTQIRDQAAQIKSLILQLEEANLKRGEAKEPFNAPSPTHSATTNTDRLSLASLPTSSLTSEVDDGSEVRSTAGDHIDKPDVLDWIAKARASLEEFGGYISMGGPSATRGMLGGDDDEVDGSPGTRTPGGVDEYEFSVFDDDDDAGTQTELGLGVDGAVSDQYLSGDEGGVGLTPGRLGPPRSVTPSEASVRRTTDKLANIPSAAAPIGFFAQLMAARRRRGSRPGSDVDDEDRGLANDEFFRPTLGPNRPITEDAEQYPRILKEGIVSPREVESLFKIYWDYMNVSVSLLDPVLYTSQKTFVRSHFLFTVICGIASKYYTQRPDLYQKLMQHARRAAGEALIGGKKSVEVVHAYILLALYPVPCRRWEDDRSWVYLGLAIRIASDLNLHHPNTATPKNELHGREMLNRTRAWLNCFNLDRSTGSQYGRPPTINNADYMANHSGEWWNSSPWNLKNFDIQIAAYNADLRVMANFALTIRGDANNPSGIDKNIDVAKVALATDEELAKLWDTWYQSIQANQPPGEADPQGAFRTCLLRLAYSYARLQALSWGFQFGFGRKGSVSTDRRLLWSAFRAARDTVKAYVDHIAIPEQRVYLRHGPEAQSVFITFACAFLIKLMQPKFAAYLTREQRVEARSLIQQVVEVLGSAEVAVDDGHYPKLYSRFLKGLLDTPMADVDRPVPVIKRESPVQEHRALQVAKAKSVSPTSTRQELYRSSSPSRETCSTPSSTRASQTPPPFGSGFDNFDQIPMNTEPYSQSMLFSADIPNVDNNFFNPLLPFDTELLQSMQTLTDPIAWPEMIMPGFAWMNPLHQADAEMA